MKLGLPGFFFFHFYFTDRLDQIAAWKIRNPGNQMTMALWNWKNFTSVLLSSPSSPYLTLDAPKALISPGSVPFLCFLISSPVKKDGPKFHHPSHAGEDPCMMADGHDGAATLGHRHRDSSSHITPQFPNSFCTLSPGVLNEWSSSIPLTPSNFYSHRSNHFKHFLKGWYLSPNFSEGIISLYLIRDHPIFSMDFPKMNIYM